MPDWWYLDYKVFLIAVGWILLNKFFKALREYRKRKGLKWNYVAGVLEFHRSGQIHFHLVFYGHWVAPLDVMHRYWPYSDFNGIEVRRHSGLNVARYLGRYIGKFKNEIDEAEPEDFVKWVWYFGTRLYNSRHRRTNKKGNKTFGIPGEVMENQVRWICVGVWISETQTLLFDRYKDEYGHLRGIVEIERDEELTLSQFEWARIVRSQRLKIESGLGDISI